MVLRRVGKLTNYFMKPHEDNYAMKHFATNANPHIILTIVKNCTKNFFYHYIHIYFSGSDYNSWAIWVSIDFDK